MLKRLVKARLIAAAMLLVASSGFAQTISAQWTQKSNGNFYPDGPGLRGWSKIFWDSGAQRLAMLGGSAGGGYKMDVWHYNISNDTWTPYLLPSDDCPGYLGFSGPDGRDAHSADYDPINNAYWSVGGSGYKCGAASGVNPTARTAGVGSSPSFIIDPGLTSTVVDFYKDWVVTVDNYRQAYVTAYDPVTKKLTLALPISGLVVGSSYTLRVWTDGQTWMYSKSNGQWTGFEGPHWGSLSPSPMSETLLARLNPGFAYSTAASVFVFHGGTSNGKGVNDTWVLDPVSKRYTQKKVDSPTGPLAVGEFTQQFVYDQANDVFVMFGGRCADSRCTAGQATGETWVYSLPTNTWTKKTPAVRPPPRMAAAMYYDASVQKVVLFGGSKVDFYNVYPTAANLLSDLWVYDVATNVWTEITATGGPSVRFLQMAGYDPIAATGVMYGGQSPGMYPWNVWTLKLTQQSANTPPVAVPAVTPSSGTTATNFAFNGTGSTDASGQITAYSWNWGDGTAATTGSTVQHTFASAGTYVVTLTVTDNAGATASATVSVPVAAVNQAPVAVASVTPGSGTVSTNFAFSSAGSADADGQISSYAWNFGDGTTATGATANHTYAAAGSFITTLTVTDNSGATSTATVPVSVAAAVASLSYKRVIQGTISNGSITQILAAGVQVPFTSAGSNFTATISGNAPGAVQVTIQYSGPGGSGSQQLSVVVP